MKKHLFLCMCLMAVTTAVAEVVYEPMIVASGFNRDVIAETTSIGTCAWSPLYDLTGGNAHTSCFGTRSVIAAINTNQGFSEADYAKTIAGGWPDDNGNPDDRVIRCSTEYLADAYQNPTFANIYWRLAPYTGPNVLTLRPGDPDSDEKGWHASGTLTFQKIGCYDQLFFLMASLRQGSGVGQRKVTTVVHYTDGTTSDQEFLFAGLGGEVGQRVQITNIYESPFKKNTNKDSNLAYVSVFPMDVNPNKLIQSIEFTNNITNTSAIIFAVTGRTADMAIPSEEASVASNIGENSFEACWEAIADAASYRLDVAEDYDFQHLVEGYNNLVVSGSTCQEVAGLIAGNDYYWRVRSVNSAGGQSASSAPKRVKTESAEGPLVTDESYETIESDMTDLLGSTMNIIVNRTLWKDGYFNTLCLPFNLAEEQLAQPSNPLYGGELYTFDHAEVLGTAQLDVHVSPATTIEAGMPYLIKWSNTGEVLHNLLFNGVTITAEHGMRVGEENEVQFAGILGKHVLPYENVNNLFLGVNNTLYWPENDGTSMKGFRAYFSIPTSGQQCAPKNTPARIVMGQNVATDIESIPSSVISNQKIIRDGQLFIIRDGILYNAQGQRMQ